jgi:hypothetical protein
MARPTDYTPELGDIICEQIGRKKALARICDESEEMPSARTVYRWLREHSEFCQNYTRAKEDQADYLAEETLEIADDETIDPQHKRIQVDTRKWLASKFKPKKYGDKLDVDAKHTGTIVLQLSESDAEL